MTTTKLFATTTLRDSFGLLSKNDKFKVLIVCAAQVFLSFLDLLGVLILGLLGVLSLNGIQSVTPSPRVINLLESLGIYQRTFQEQVAILGILAAALLVFKTIISIFLTKKILYFLSRRGALLTYELLRKLLSLPLIRIQEYKLQESLYSLTYGVSSVTIGIIGNLVLLIADISLLVIMTLALVIVNPLMAFFTVLFFGVVGFALFRMMHKKALSLGNIESRLTIECNQKILEILSMYRELLIRNRREYYAVNIGKLRLDLSNTLAEIAFLPNVSKYVIESSLIVGGLFFCAIQFLFQDSTQSVATLAIFLSASTRIAPAVLRIQQGSIQIRKSLGSASPTLRLFYAMKDVSGIDTVASELCYNHDGFDSKIVMSNVSFKYPSAQTWAINNVNLVIEAGKNIAIVGPSGSGKTTLVDLILGLIKPDHGAVVISGLNADQIPFSWPGAAGYVPQDVIVIDGTIKTNVTLGFPDTAETQDLVLHALTVAQLEEFVYNAHDGVDTEVGERGVSMSGGQRQRLGIARALFTKPKLLVLDEATSALDGETECDVADAIRNLKGEVTVISVAHRLSTVREADQVVYLEGGNIVSVGTFDEVRLAVPNFDRQASLMGL